MTIDYQDWLWQKLGERCVKNLQKHHFDAHLTANVEEARALILSMVQGYETFGFGGSDTTRSMGIIKALKEQGKTIFDHHDATLSPEEKLACRRQQLTCDCFFSSANAIALTGAIVNVDGAGNRVNAMTFGPKKVIIVAGMNKVTADVDSALQRVRDIAAPMDAKKFEGLIDTPCIHTGVCSDCNSPTRICCITSILHRKPMMTDVSVILIRQALGY